MKIAFFTSLVLEHGGGLEHLYIETARELKKQYPSTTIDIVSNSRKFSERLIFFLSIFYFKKIGKKVLRKKAEIAVKEELGTDVKYIKATSIKNLKNILKSYDVIYSKNEIVEAYIFKYLLKYKNMPPVVFGCHTSLFYTDPRSIQDRIRNFVYTGPIYKTFVNEAKGFHVTSSSDEAVIRKLFPDKKILKTLNPFNVEKYTSLANTNRFQHSFDQTKKNILWVGSLTQLKGSDDLLQIIDLINKKGVASTIQWNIVGSGPELKKFQDLKKAWDNINLLGHIAKDFLPSVYKANNLFISTSYVETFGYTLVEALSFDLPVITRSNSGARELIENGKNGYLVNNVDEFVEKIMLFIESGIEIDQKHKETLMKKLDKSSINEKLMSLLKSVSR